MKKGILGVNRMNTDYGAPGDPVHISLELIAEPLYNAHHLLSEQWDQIFPGKVIVKCEYCGQWGARTTSCGHCGHSID